MNRLPGVVFHTLKGSNGWSICDLCRVDVARIVQIDYRERTFCLFDQDKPFSVWLKYYLPKVESATRTVPVFGWGVGVGMTSVTETSLEQYITKRYSSEYDAQKEVAAIKKKMERLDDFALKLEAAACGNPNELFLTTKTSDETDPSVSAAKDNAAPTAGRRPATNDEVDKVLAAVRGIDPNVDRAHLLVELCAKWKFLSESPPPRTEMKTKRANDCVAARRQDDDCDDD